MDYQEFLDKKRFVVRDSGHIIDRDSINDVLYDYQKVLVDWAVRKGKAAIFADTGLGKTFMTGEYARLIGGHSLMVAPLGVAKQTVGELKTIGIDVKYVRSQSEVNGEGVYITNYEMIEHFSPDCFTSVILDESSILKSIDGKTKSILTDMFQDVPYRLCATATPAPNDITEIANHAEFLGVMTRQEMLAMFFTYNNAGGTSKVDSWRLKKHATEHFYEWMASWSMAIKKPSDLGYSDDGFLLPPLNVNLVTVESDYAPDGMLPGFFVGGISATDASRIRRQTIGERNAIISDMVNSSDEQWIVWCGLNDEANDLISRVSDAVNVEGSMSPEQKADAMMDFQNGNIRVLITKTSIAGFGMNFQNSHNQIWNGMSYSWESYYQGVRRQWRHGQKEPVNVTVVTSSQEQAVFDTVMQKEKEAIKMGDELIKRAKRFMQAEIKFDNKMEFNYMKQDNSGKNWRMWLGDSVERMQEIEDESVDFSIYSPPFWDVFTYSATERDLGNSRDMDTFWEHYRFIIRENLRIQKPGTRCAVHIQDGRAIKYIDGYIGRKDASGACIEEYVNAGWIFSQRLTVNKNPQIQAIRLKDHGLAFKTLKKDARQLNGGYAEYILIFTKPGSADPVTTYADGEVTSEDWINWAHPVWMADGSDVRDFELNRLSKQQLVDLIQLMSGCFMDIDEGDVLNVKKSKGKDDEKHLCPLQLPLIARLIRLYTNQGELVFSPFAGIGSEGYEAIKHKRRFLGIELKPEYWNVACRNLTEAERHNGMDMFEYMAQMEED